MIIAHDFVAHAPMEAVFDALTAEPVLSGLRGVDVLGRDADGNVEGTLELVVDGAPLRFKGQLSALDVDREAGAVTMTLNGRQGRSRQQSRCLVAVRLRSSDGSTRVSMQLDLEIPGRATRADAQPLREAVLGVVDELAAAVRARLETEPVGGGGPAVAPAPVTAPAADSAPTPGPVQAGSVPTPAPAEPATAPGSPRPRYADPGSPVPGRVVVVTDAPLDAASLPVGDSATDRVRTAAARRPWVAPAVLLVLLALALLWRGRRRRRRGRRTSAGD
jgi:carbon monoxide dehydrogenase subunit G